jgi:hypothetical protein
MTYSVKWELQDRVPHEETFVNQQEADKLWYSLLFNRDVIKLQFCRHNGVIIELSQPGPVSLSITYKHPRATREMLGYIPNFLDESDPRGAVEQLHENYMHGGGWHPYEGFTMLPNGNLKSSFPEDPDTQLLAEIQFRHEVVRVYQHAWVAVVQPDGSYAVARMD